MATRVRIDCIDKNNRQSRYERISHVGGPNADATRWRLKLEDAIIAIETGLYSFFTDVGNHEVDVVVAKTAQGRKYLKTVADADTPDSLLRLPKMPLAGK